VWGISWLAEVLLASQELLCYMELFIIIIVIIIVKNASSDLLENFIDECMVDVL